jgi:hypothetical protein
VPTALSSSHADGLIFVDDSGLRLRSLQVSDGSEAFPPVEADSGLRVLGLPSSHSLFSIAADRGTGRDSALWSLWCDEYGDIRSLLLDMDGGRLLLNITAAEFSPALPPGQPPMQPFLPPTLAGVGPSLAVCCSICRMLPRSGCSAGCSTAAQAQRSLPSVCPWPAASSTLTWTYSACSGCSAARTATAPTPC